ncbi:MAG TPA: hypothetical protein VGN12_27445 [Pirellulales bacterium]|jgi:hypothetical protein
MELLTDRQVHPFCEILPEPEDEQFDVLCDDIRKHGIQTNVIVYENKILDGRCRSAAAKIVGCPVPEEEFVGTDVDAILLVFSKNLARRHLNPGQRAAMACDFRDMVRSRNTGNDSTVDASGNYFPEVKKAANPSGKNSGGKTQKELDAERPDAKVAEKLGTNRTSMRQYDAVKARDPGLAAAVSSGKIRLGTAAKKLASRETIANGTPVKDQLGNEIPESLVSAFEAAKDALHMLDAINKLMHEAKELCEGPGGKYISKTRLEIELGNTRGYLKSVLPYALCPDCAGAGCRHCHQNGWITRSMYRNVPDEPTSDDTAPKDVAPPSKSAA